MKNILTIQSPLLPEGTRVVSAVGAEGLSRLYRFEIGLLVTDPTFNADDAVDATATLHIIGGDAEPMAFHGMLCSVEHLHEWQGQALLRVVLVPRAFNLTLTQHSRVFVEQSDVDIVRAVFEQNGMANDDYAFRLSGQYAAIAHVCQYKESDYAFVARRLQRAGLYFYFEHGDERDKLIITDSAAIHQPWRSAPARYVPLSGDDDMALEAFHAFRSSRRSVPAHVALNDYDYINPQLDLAVEAPIAQGQHRSISAFGDNYLTPADGGKRAQIKAEGYIARRKVFRGSGRVFKLRSGYTFDLAEHPREAFNTGYLATEVQHYANQATAGHHARELLGIDFDDSYRAEVVAIAADVQYRHPAPPWPRIDGYEIAVIDGPADSPFAQIDAHGRYKVKIKFDESALTDGGASTWVRMLQGHGGGTEGMHFPLRKGTEVLLLFLGGDPDRPVIAGVAPNALTPSPVAEGNPSLNMLVTGANNKLAMDDETVRIELSCPTENSYLHLGAPYEDHKEHLVLNTSKDALFNFGDDWDIEAGGEKFEHVAGNVVHHYDGKRELHIAHDYVQNVFRGEGGGSSNRRRYVQDGEEVHIGKTREVFVGGDHTLVTPKKTRIAAGKAFIEMESGHIRIDNGMGTSIDLAGPHLEIKTLAGDIVLSAQTEVVTTATVVSTSAMAGIEQFARAGWVAAVGDPEAPTSMGMTPNNWRTYSTGTASLVSATEMTLASASVAIAGGEDAPIESLAIAATELAISADKKADVSAGELSLNSGKKTIIASQGVIEVQGAVAKIN